MKVDREILAAQTHVVVDVPEQTTFTISLSVAEAQAIAALFGNLSYFEAGEHLSVAAKQVQYFHALSLIEIRDVATSLYYAMGKAGVPVRSGGAASQYRRIR